LPIVSKTLRCAQSRAFDTGLDLPGYRLHQLKGNRAGTWSVTVSGNWRVTFTFEGEDAYDVDLEDYH
jgi:proteic killer suppression protein